MKRRTLLVVLGTLSATSAGCLSLPSETPNDNRGGGEETTEYTDTRTENTDNTDKRSVVEYFDSGISRPDCEQEVETVKIEIGDEVQEFETAATLPYPDSPTEGTQDEVVEYVETFEHAYVTKSVLCDRNSSGYIFRISYSVLEKELFDWYDDITVVFLRRIGAASSGSDGEGNLWESDVDFDGVVYAIDQTGVARVDFPEVHTIDSDEFGSHAPDPLDKGDLVAVFE